MRIDLSCWLSGNQSGNGRNGFKKDGIKGISKVFVLELMKPFCSLRIEKKSR